MNGELCYCAKVRNGAGARLVAGHASRIAAGHPGGYLEAFA
jgi:hypothetical protein